MEVFLYEVVNSIPNTVSGIVILIGILIGSRVECGGKNDVISVCLDREAVTDILSIVYAVKLVTGGRTDYDYLIICARVLGRILQIVDQPYAAAGHVLNCILKCDRSLVLVGRLSKVADGGSAYLVSGALTYDGVVGLSLCIDKNKSLAYIELIGDILCRRHGSYGCILLAGGILGLAESFEFNGLDLITGDILHQAHEILSVDITIAVKIGMECNNIRSRHVLHQTHDIRSIGISAATVDIAPLVAFTGSTRCDRKCAYSRHCCCNEGSKLD